MTILVDTGPLLAYADTDDRHHAAVSAFLEEVNEPLMLPSTVIPEACFMVGRFLGARAEALFLAGLTASDMLLEPVTLEDLQRSAALIEQYADSHIGVVDASIIALAERYNITKLLTVDRRHFHMVRPRHTKAFTLLP